MKPSEIAALLRKHGYRLTSQRSALLKVISASRQRFTPGTIYRRVRKDYPGIGVVTVYRTLEALDELGLICRVHTADGCQSYLIKTPAGHHHHLVCTSCGRVVDVTGCDIAALENKVARKTGFTISSHLLEFEGTCRDCTGHADPTPPRVSGL